MNLPTDTELFMTASMELELEEEKAKWATT